MNAGAQTLGDTVEDHVQTELKESEKRSKEKKEKTPQPQKKKEAPETKVEAKSKDDAKQSGEGSTILSIQDGKVKRAPTESELPKRVLPEGFEFDPQAGVGYRGWAADQYPALQMQTQNYFQWYVGFHARLFKTIRIYRAFYQSTGLRSPRPTGAVLAESSVKAAPAAATKVLGMMGVQVRFVLIPMLRYEARSYEATAIPNQPVRIVPFSASRDDETASIPLTENSLRATSNFETLIVGMRYNDKLESHKEGIKKGEFPLPFYFGAGFTRYSKPYQVRVGDSVLDELVFNGRFKGAGLALGFDLPGGINQLELNFAGQVGLGEILLTHDLSLNDVLPSDWLMGYARGDLKAAYTIPLLKTRPTLLFSPLASVGGTTFFYINKDGDSSETPMANWDVLWSAMARFIVPL